MILKTKLMRYPQTYRLTILPQVLLSSLINGVKRGGGGVEKVREKEGAPEGEEKKRKKKRERERNEERRGKG